jgi:lipoate-protein ligase A
VRFHRYPACVLVGAGQDVRSAADLGYCQRAGIAVARRISGGGAVYMSPGMLAWDVVVDRSACGDGLDGVTREVCSGLAAGLSRLGAKARFRPPNDIEIGGRKVSGSGGYAVGRSAVLQGTILLADEVADMASALRLPESALRERTTCIEIEIGGAPSLASLVEVMTEGLAEALDRKPVSGWLHQNELALCEILLRGDIDDNAYVLRHTAGPA